MSNTLSEIKEDSGERRDGQLRYISDIDERTGGRPVMLRERRGRETRRRLSEPYK
jgi:hypothetical protein